MKFRIGIMSLNSTGKARDPTTEFGSMQNHYSLRLRSLGKMLELGLLKIPGMTPIHQFVKTWQMRPRVIEVQIDYFSFMPHEITIAAGATVTWVNLDDVQHKVTSTDRTFKSRVLRTDDKFSFKFDEPGTYEYYCSIHPKMRGKVIVQ
jgi:plastocyanin